MKLAKCSSIIIFNVLNVLLVVGANIFALQGILQAQEVNQDCKVRLIGFNKHHLSEIAEAKFRAREVRGTLLQRREKVMKQIAENLGVDVEQSIGLNALKVEGNTNELDTVDDIADKSPLFDYSECDGNASLFKTSNDPELARRGWGEMWGLWHNYGIQAPAAWDISTGSRDVIVGVIDTGIEYTHSDLVANMFTNPGEIPGDGIDNDQNGYVDDVMGYDFVNRDNDAKDDHYHGTHVAGTIGGVGDNGIGVVGVNWQVSLVPLKVLNNNGSGAYSWIAEAVSYMANLKRKYPNRPMVINMSLGGPSSSQTLQNAITDAKNAGVAVIVAAGNSTQNNDQTPSYPANCSGAFAVAATGAGTGASNTLAYFSNYGVNTVPVAAPGYSITSTYPGNQYSGLSGTSMASPHVAGLAALMLSVNSNLTVDQIYNTITNTTTKFPDLQGKVSSGGLINAYAALSAIRSPILQGTVDYNLGGTMPGVTINGGALGTKTTNSFGNYIFDNVPSNADYTLTPSLQCYTFTPPYYTGKATKVVNDVPHFQGSYVQYTMRGKVLDTNGNPLEGAAVNVTGINNYWAPQNINTLPDGSFYFQAGCGASYRILVTKSSYLFAERSLMNITDGSQVIIVSAYIPAPTPTPTNTATPTYTPTPIPTSTPTMTPTSTPTPTPAWDRLTVQVTTNSQQRLSGARGILTVNNQKYSFLTDSDGQYVVPDLLLRGSTFSLTVTKPGYTSAQSSGSVTANGVATVNLGIKSHAVSGRTLNRQGNVLSGVTVTFISNTLALSTTSDSSGRFSFQNIPYGEKYTLSASLTNYLFIAKGGIVLGASNKRVLVGKRYSP